MTDTSVQTASKKNVFYQFTIRSLLGAILITSWTLAVNRWLGSPYGWITAIPVAMVGVLVLRTSGWALLGGIIGFVAMTLIGLFFIIGWPPSDPRFMKSVVAVGSYGAAGGASLHAMALKQWILGTLLLIATIVVFAILLHA
jgi:hypothetical protein